MSSSSNSAARGRVGTAAAERDAANEQDRAEKGTQAAAQGGGSSSSSGFGR